jgi:antirestriction protein ArdC
MSKQSGLQKEITQRIVDTILNGGLPPWRKNWKSDNNCGIPTNVASKRAYTGVNPLILNCSSMRHDFSSRFWGTVKQWNHLGGRIMKRPELVEPGQWGTKICYWSKTTNTKIDADGNKKEESFFFLKTYHVFNIDQVEGDHLDHLRAGNAPLTEEQIEERQERAEKVIEAIPATIKFGGNKAFYTPKHDFIQMPFRHQFETIGGFYETMFHELGHWSESRTNWDREQGYACGELRAELTACFICQELGIEGGNFDQSCSYLKGWLESLQNDPSFIFKASSAASKAVDYLLSFSRTEDESSVEEELVA